MVFTLTSLSHNCTDFSSVARTLDTEIFEELLSDSSSREEMPPKLLL